jgi:hypothetical protein
MLFLEELFSKMQLSVGFALVTGLDIRVFMREIV